MGKNVNTALGPISPAELGMTLVHEHLVFGYPGWQFDTAAPAYNREQAAARCTEAVLKAKEYGVRAIVDATPNDGTRDPKLYKMVSEKTGVNIICATGLYNEAEGAVAYFKSRVALSGQPGLVVQEMYETFVKDIAEGIGDSGVKAGVIKVGTSKGQITAYEALVLEAAVKAQQETGVPIITHTEAGTMGPQQVDLLLSKGADPKRLLIGHMCGNSDVNYHLEALPKGVYLGFDRFGLGLFMPDDLRIKTVADLVKKGYAGQIMLSQDYIIQWLGRELPIAEQALPLVDNWHLTNLFEKIIPALQAAGVTRDQIDTMLVDNPRRLFAGE